MAADTPAWAGRRRVLLRGGNVYSPADPFATAMLLDGPVVAWIGSDGAALALADGVDELVELDGALVTPGFVDAHVGVTGAAAGDGAPGAGVGIGPIKFAFKPAAAKPASKAASSM